MASIQQDPSGNFHISFRFAGQRFKRSLKTKHERKAEATASHVEENIRLVESGRLTLPDDADIPTFLMSDGRVIEKPELPKTLTLGNLFDRYEESIPEGAFEQTTLHTAKIHMRHIERILGAKKLLRTVTTKDLQTYVTARSKAPGHRGNLSATTIRKELETFSSLWNWAAGHGYVKGGCPKRGLVFPKQDERPPFRTWAQIERQIAEQELSESEAEVLWECLYLSTKDVEKLLSYIKANSRYPFLYPMAYVAAHTGARRSELCRILTSDVDLKDDRLIVHERKRCKSKKTTRSIPISPGLHQVLSEWLKAKPQSPFLFPEDHSTPVKRRSREEEGCVTPIQAGYHLKLVLAQSDWKNLRGWHVFRHSFISQCASKGIDQRFIDSWVGHQTEEQRRRYRHLFPDSQKEAISLVFA